MQSKLARHKTNSNISFNFRASYKPIYNPTGKLLPKLRVRLHPPRRGGHKSTPPHPTATNNIGLIQNLEKDT